MPQTLVRELPFASGEWLFRPLVRPGPCVGAMVAASTPGPEIEQYF
jgi:hypothetical protein